MFRRFVFFAVVCIVELSALTVSAQPETIGAGVVEGDLYLYTSAEAIRLTQDGQGNFDHIAWYGNIVAFSRRDADNVQSLWISLDGQTPFVVATGLDAFYPFAFTPEGNLLFAANTSAVNDSQFMTDVFTVAPEDGAAPQLIGQIDSTIAMIGGCGGGSPLPTDWQYWNEAGFGGRHHTLEQTPFGIVYTLDCIGSRTALHNLETNAMTQLGVNFGNVNLSADQAHLVGTVFDSSTPEIPKQLAVVDLATADFRLIETEATPDQVVWSSDGDAIFYTVYEVLSEPVPMTASELETLSLYFGAGDGPFQGFPLHQVQIHRYDLLANVDEVIYSAPEDTASIGRLFALDEGTLIFSQIPNLQNWIAAVAEGKIDLSSLEDTTDRQLAAVPVRVMSLGLGSGDVTEIGTGINLFTPS